MAQQSQKPMLDVAGRTLMAHKVWVTRSINRMMSAVCWHRRQCRSDSDSFYISSHCTRRLRVSSHFVTATSIMLWHSPDFGTRFGRYLETDFTIARQTRRAGATSRNFPLIPIRPGKGSVFPPHPTRIDIEVTICSQPFLEEWTWLDHNMEFPRKFEK